MAVSFTTLGSTLWRGGMLEEKTNSNTARIATIENQGSSGLRAHEQMDDQRIGDLNHRLAALEQDRSLIAAMRVDVGVIKTQVEILSKQLIPQTSKPISVW
jgi:hypothetical protein